MADFTLVIFSWCPRGGVGSRRWSKFSKYLSRKGKRISVITASYSSSDEVNWCHDVNGLANLNTTYLPLGYPAFLLRKSRNFTIKLFSRLLAKTTHTIDPAQRWVNQVINHLATTDDNGAVVVTVPPFSLMAAVPRLAEVAGDSGIILDYRDPYQHFQGYQAHRIEGQALALCREVWVTTKEHRNALTELYEISPERVRIIPNGYDDEDYRELPIKPGTGGKAVYLGQLMELRLFHLLDVLSYLDSGPFSNLQREFHLDIYTASSIPAHKFSPLQAALFKKYVTVCAPVPADKVPVTLIPYRFGVTVGVDGYNLSIPVKNFEYLALGKQVVSFGPITDFHREMANDGHLVADFSQEQILQLFAKMELLVATGFECKPPRQYDVANITKSIEDRLSQLAAPPR